MDTRPVSASQDDWRDQLPPNARLLIARNLVERLDSNYLSSGQVVRRRSLEVLKKIIAEYFEQVIYKTSASQDQYLQQAYFMIWGVVGMSQRTSGNHNRPLDTGACYILHAPVHSKVEPLPTLVSSQNTPPSNTGSTEVQSPALLTSQNILVSLAHHLTTEYSMGGKQKVVPELVRPKLRHGFQYVYQQVLILTSHHEQESLQRTLVKSQMAQLKQELENLLRPVFEKPNMQISSAMEDFLPLLSNQTQSAESTPMMQQSLLLPHQQQHFRTQHPNSTDMPQQRWPGQQNNHIVNIGNPVGPLSQNTVSAPLHANVTDFSSQSSWVNILQRQHPRFNRKGKQHLPAEMQVHQRNDFDEIKRRQEMGVKPDVFQQHISDTPYTGQLMILEGFDRCSPPSAAISNLKLNAEKEANARKKSKAGKKK